MVNGTADTATHACCTFEPCQQMISSRNVMAEHRSDAVEMCLLQEAFGDWRGSSFLLKEYRPASLVAKPIMFCQMGHNINVLLLIPMLHAQQAAAYCYTVLLRCVRESTISDNRNTCLHSAALRTSCCHLPMSVVAT